MAGLTAAGELARNGVSVLLLERDPRLGGHAGRWACMATGDCRKCSACLVEDARASILEHELVQVHTGGTLAGLSRNGGGMEAQVVPHGADADAEGVAAGAAEVEGVPLREATTWEVDAVFVATGFDPFPAEGKPMLLYGENPSVITTVDLNRLVREHRLDSLPGMQGDGMRVAFLQCVGSRDRVAGRDYCSQVCCKTSLRLASRLLHDHPAGEITLFYIDLQLCGKGFRSFYGGLAPSIRTVQGVPSEVLPVEGDGAALVFEDPDSGETRTETFDLVVLAVGMVPAAGASALAAGVGLARARGGFFEPTEGPAEGPVYIVGACKGPVDIQGARRQAKEAVARYLTRDTAGG